MNRTEKDILRRPANIWPSKKNFTLLELLVIISIIMILIALLLPALRKAKETAYAIACMSNIRQCGNGFNFYAMNYNGYFPLNQTVRASDGWTLWTDGTLPWNKAVVPYTNAKTRCCPGYPLAGGLAIPWAYHFSTNTGSSFQERGIKAFKLKNPSNKGLVFDYGIATTYKTGNYYLPGSWLIGRGSWYQVQQQDYSWDLLPANNLLADYKAGRHFNAINTYFADGHAAKLKARDAFERFKAYSTLNFFNFAE